MPAWWGRKSTKTTKTDPPEKKSLNPYSNRNSYVVKSPPARSTNTSFDEPSPRVVSKDLGTASSGFSGFESDGGSKGHPLPRPSVSSPHGGGPGNDQGVGLGSASGSVSSGTSSVSSDDQPVLAAFRLGILAVFDELGFRF